MRRLLALALALMLLLPAAHALEEDMYFPQPEDSIRYFADCMKNQDMEGAALSMAAQSVARYFNTPLYLSRTKAITPTMPNRFPGNAPQYLSLNTQINRANNMLSVQGFISSLALPDMADAQRYGMIPATEEGLLIISPDLSLTLDAYADRFAPANFAGLELKALYENIHPTMKEDSFQQNYAVYGAEVGREYLAVYALDGQTFRHGYTVVKYPEGWQILRLNAPLSGTPAMGSAEKIDQEALDKLDADTTYTKVYPEG